MGSVTEPVLVLFPDRTHLFLDDDNSIASCVARDFPAHTVCTLFRNDVILLQPSRFLVRGRAYFVVPDASLEDPELGRLLRRQCEDVQSSERIPTCRQHGLSQKAAQSTGTGNRYSPGLVPLDLFPVYPSCAAPPPRITALQRRNTEQMVESDSRRPSAKFPRSSTGGEVRPGTPQVGRGGRADGLGPDLRLGASCRSSGASSWQKASDAPSMGGKGASRQLRRYQRSLTEPAERGCTIGRMREGEGKAERRCKAGGSRRRDTWDVADIAPGNSADVAAGDKHIARSVSSKTRRNSAEGKLGKQAEVGRGGGRAVLGAPGVSGLPAVCHGWNRGERRHASTGRKGGSGPMAGSWSIEKTDAVGLAGKPASSRFGGNRLAQLRLEHAHVADKVVWARCKLGSDAPLDSGRSRSTSSRATPISGSSRVSALAGSSSLSTPPGSTSLAAISGCNVSSVVGSSAPNLGVSGRGQGTSMTDNEGGLSFNRTLTWNAGGVPQALTGLATVPSGSGSREESAREEAEAEGQVEGVGGSKSEGPVQRHSHFSLATELRTYIFGLVKQQRMEADQPGRQHSPQHIPGLADCCMPKLHKGDKEKGGKRVPRTHSVSSDGTWTLSSMSGSKPFWSVTDAVSQSDPCLGGPKQRGSSNAGRLPFSSAKGDKYHPLTPSSVLDDLPRTGGLQPKTKKHGRGKATSNRQSCA